MPLARSFSRSACSSGEKEPLSTGLLAVSFLAEEEEPHLRDGSGRSFLEDDGEEEEDMGMSFAAAESG